MARQTERDMTGLHHPFRLVLDWCACGVAVASFLGYLPTIAAALSIIWLVIQIAEWIKTKF